MYRSIQVAAALVAAALAIAFIAPAGAAVSVIGLGPEKQCYEASKAGRADKGGLAACDSALENSLLSRRDRAATHVNRSVLLLAHRRVRAALADTDMALRLEPDMAPASVNRAAALIRLERYAEARAALDGTLDGAEVDVLTRGLFNRAIASEALGDLRAAYADFRRIVELDPAFVAAQPELARFRVSSR